MKEKLAESVQSVEDYLGIPWIGHDGQSYADRKHVLWTHLGYSWAVARPYYPKEEEYTYDLAKDLTRKAGSVLKKFQELDEAFFDPELGEKAREFSLSLYHGEEYYRLADELSFRHQRTDRNHCLWGLAELWHLARDAALFGELSSQADTGISVGFGFEGDIEHQIKHRSLGCNGNVHYLKHLIEKYEANCQLSFFLSCDYGGEIAHNLGFIGKPSKNGDDATIQNAQWSQFQQIAQDNPEVFLLGTNADACVGHSFRDLYRIFEKVNVLYDFSVGVRSLQTEHDYYIDPKILDVLQAVISADTLDEKIRLLVEELPSESFKPDNKLLFSPQQFANQEAFEDLRENIHKVHLMSEEEAIGILNIRKI